MRISPEACMFLNKNMDTIINGKMDYNLVLRYFKSEFKCEDVDRSILRSFYNGLKTNDKFVVDRYKNEVGRVESLFPPLSEELLNKYNDRISEYNKEIREGRSDDLSVKLTLQVFNTNIDIINLVMSNNSVFLQRDSIISDLRRLPFKIEKTRLHRDYDGDKSKLAETYMSLEEAYEEDPSAVLDEITNYVKFIVKRYARQMGNRRVSLKIASKVVGANSNDGVGVFENELTNKVDSFELKQQKLSEESKFRYLLKKINDYSLNSSVYKNINILSAVVAIDDYVSDRVKFNAAGLSYSTLMKHIEEKGNLIYINPDVSSGRVYPEVIVDFTAYEEALRDLIYRLEFDNVSVEYNKLSSLLIILQDMLTYNSSLREWKLKGRILNLNSLFSLTATKADLVDAILGELEKYENMLKYRMINYSYQHLMGIVQGKTGFVYDRVKKNNTSLGYLYLVKEVLNIRDYKSFDLVKYMKAMSYIDGVDHKGIQYLKEIKTYDKTNPTNPFYTNVGKSLVAMLGQVRYDKFVEKAEYLDFVYQTRFKSFDEVEKTNELFEDLGLSYRLSRESVEKNNIIFLGDKVPLTIPYEVLLSSLYIEVNEKNYTERKFNIFIESTMKDTVMVLSNGVLVLVSSKVDETNKIIYGFYSRERSAIKWNVLNLARKS